MLRARALIPRAGYRIPFSGEGIAVDLCLERPLDPAAQSRLTMRFGFGANLFSKDGADRHGLALLRVKAP